MPGKCQQLVERLVTIASEPGARGVRAKMPGKVSAYIGLRLPVQILKKPDRSAEKSVVAIARHHV